MKSLEEQLALIRRGVEQVERLDELKQKLERSLRTGTPLRVKFGIDPTSIDVHLGHTVPLRKLRQFQDLGHEVIVIIGDFTAMIGDPSGRSETRPMLTRQQVDVNARTYFEQAYLALDPDRTEVHGNAEWLGEMTNAEVLRLMGTSTLQQVLQRDDFAGRLREGQAIGAHEVLYPFNQAYDSVAVRSDLEIGGTDQLFNLLFAREVQRAYGQAPQDVAVFPLLEGLDGTQKMSKSLGNYIGISEDPREIYGKVMSIPDRLIERYLRLVSGLPAPEIERTLGLPARDSKAALARRLVSRLHGEPAGTAAEEDFESKFRRRSVEPSGVPVVELAPGATVAEAIVAAGLRRSLSQARKLCDQGGVRVDGRKVAFDRAVDDGEVLKIGKKDFLRIRLR
jgi:tyrosyl-tRNA synthetase